MRIAPTLGLGGKLFLDPVERKVNRVLRYAVGHAHVMLASLTEGTARSDGDFRIFQQSDGEVERISMLGHDFRKHIVCAVGPGIFEDVRHAIESLANAVATPRE